MGIVIAFPESRSGCGIRRSNGGQCESATIIILPVIRIERCGDEPSDGLSHGASSGRKRRRRATRS
jgi:hypothetical protein